MSHTGPAPSTTDEPASKAGRSEALLRPVRVLLVDDDVDIRETLCEALEEEDFVVTTAANGREALESLKRGPRPAVILLDLMMPVMDGWSFRHEQMEDPNLRQIPVVVVSAAGFSADTIRTELGDVDLVPKPVHYLTLLETLGRICHAPSPAA
jgi:CheY-like chemotaxis protein